MKDVRRRFSLSKLPKDSSDYKANNINLWKVLSILLFLFLAALLVSGNIIGKNGSDGINENIYVKQLEASLTKLEHEFRLFKDEEVPKIQQRSYDLGVSDSENKKNDVLENEIKNKEKIVQKYKNEIKKLNSKIDTLESDLSTYKKQEMYLKSACQELMKLRSSKKTPSYCKVSLLK